MLIIFLLAVLLSFGPGLFYAWVVYRMDPFEREPRLLLGGVFFWGAFVATVGALISQIVLQRAILAVTSSPSAATATGATVFAPLTEEALKGLGVLAVFLFLRKEFDSILDGIVYAGVAALGFAATENVLYLFAQGEKQGVGGVLQLFVLRVLLGAWNHPMYTALAGIGLGISRMSPRGLVQFLAPPVGWAAGVLAHSFHNALAVVGQALAGKGAASLLLMLLTDWLGWMGMTLILVLAIRHEGDLIKRYLSEEVAWGYLSQVQHATASSSLAQWRARLYALSSGYYGTTARFYQVCGELAHKKHQLARLGDEGDTVATIDRLRAELAHLSPAAVR